jgi:hypothetical protein
MRNIVGALLLAACLFVTPSSGAVSGPPAPTNLEVVATTQDSISIAWGPAQPGEFYFVAADRNWVVVGWGPSQDTRSAVTYSLWRDGTLVANGLTTTSYRLGGVNRKATTFRTCVQAFNAAGQASPQMCATWNRT